MSAAQMTESVSAVRLLDVDPDIARFLSNEDRMALRKLVLPVVGVPKGTLQLPVLLDEVNGFGAIVLEGMLMHRLRIGDQVTVRLLGPGDVVSLTEVPRSMLLAESNWSAAAWTQLAVLGDEVLGAVRRWPRLAAGVYVRVAEQADRLAAQLVISQMPRVDQRVLALLWLLAESWGHVGPAGTMLPVSLTHDALGALIGARRPTVTLALGELSDRGAIVRQNQGWLLLEQPPAPTDGGPAIEQPSLITGARTDWTSQEDADPASDRQDLMSALGALREEHVRNRDQVRQRLAEMAVSRERCRAIRQRIAQQSPTGEDLSRRAPS